MASPNALNAIRLGGRFRVGLALARTPYGEMFAADTAEGEKALAHVLSPRFAENPVFKDRFLNETARIDNVNERGIPRSIGQGVSEGFAYVLYEPLDGEFVETRRRKQLGRISVLDAYPIAQQFLDIIVSFHSRNILHGDLRPQHLFLESRGTLRIFNAGLGQISHHAITSATPGEFFPFPDYLANLPPSVATDIWGIGATLFQLLSGVAPARGALGFRSLLDVAQHVPKPLAEVIDRALHVKPDNRWPTASAMRDALEEARSPETSHDGSVLSLASKGSDPPNPFDNAMETETVTNVANDRRVALGHASDVDETEVITSLAAGEAPRDHEELTLTAPTYRHSVSDQPGAPHVATDEHLAFDDASTAITESATESIITEDAAIVLASALEKGNSTTLTRPDHFPLQPKTMPLRAARLEESRPNAGPVATPQPIPAPPPPPEPPVPEAYPRALPPLPPAPTPARGAPAKVVAPKSQNAALRRWEPLLAFVAGILLIWTIALLLIKATFFE